MFCADGTFRMFAFKAKLADVTVEFGEIGSTTDIIGAVQFWKFTTISFVALPQLFWRVNLNVLTPGFNVTLLVNKVW